MSEQEKISQIVQELLLHAGEFPKRDLSAIGRYVYNRERDLERQLSEARKENDVLAGRERLAYQKFDDKAKELTAYQSAFGKVREKLINADHELGVPQPGYPAPVANASGFIKDALTLLSTLNAQDEVKP